MVRAQLGEGNHSGQRLRCRGPCRGEVRFQRGDERFPHPTFVGFAVAIGDEEVVGGGHGVVPGG
jgi:hypothetical protein